MRLLNWGKKPEDYTPSIDHLFSERARSLAHDLDLKISEILPLCAQVNKEIYEAGGKLTRLVDNTNDHASSLIEHYSKMTCAAAVMGYELAERSSITFPKPEAKEVYGVQNDVMKELRKQRWRAQRRVELPKCYELTGKLFESNLLHIDYHLREGMIVIYAQDHQPPWKDSPTAIVL